ncbi:Uncharacterized protein OBRU01_19892, partial [Operophtera brumata]
CLSTVDRRSRERFIESNQQIAALVEKFKVEGHAIMQGAHHESSRILNPNKVQMNYGKPSGANVIWMLYVEGHAIMQGAHHESSRILNPNKNGMKQMFMRLLTLPIYFLILWAFYNEAKMVHTERVTTKNLRRGCTAVPVCYSPGIWILSDITETLDYVYFSLIVWSCYIYAEQQSLAIMMFVKNGLIAAMVNIYITCVSYKGFEEWLYYLTYVTHTRYASIFLHRSVFRQPTFNILPYSDHENCTSITNLIQTSSSLNTNSNSNCRYASGKAFLSERFAPKSFNGDLYQSGEFDTNFNLGISFAFSVGIMVFNKFLYLIPLPSYITDKFRE